MNILWTISYKAALTTYVVLILVITLANCFSVRYTDDKYSRNYSNDSTKLREELLEFAYKNDIPENLVDSKYSTVYMLTLFKKLIAGTPLDVSANVVRKSHQMEMVNTVRTFSSKVSGNSKSTFQFHIPSLPVDEVLKQTEIRFKSDSVKNYHPKSKIVLTIEKSGKIVRKVTLRATTIVQGDHLVFDITNKLSPWINGYKGNFTIHLSANLKHNRTTEDSVHPGQQKDDNCPIMVLFFQNAQFIKELHDSGALSYTPKSESVSTFLHRSKRSTKRGNRSQKRNKLLNKTRRRKLCRPLDFQVDFNAIGWGKYIIFPKTYNARMCKGTCPSPVKHELFPSNHAMIQSLMRLGNKKAIPMPCCVPTKLEPLSMLYFENGEIVVRHHADMIAKQCGCR